MIFPKLLSYSSPDLDTGSLPPDPEHCLVAVTATVGSADRTGGDNFSFVVATPSALAASANYGWGRGTLIVESFSWADVEQSLTRLVDHAARETWQDVAEALNKELLWEFDNYQPS